MATLKHASPLHVRSNRASLTPSPQASRLRWLSAGFVILASFTGVLWLSGWNDTFEDPSLSRRKPVGIGGAFRLPGRGAVVLPALPPAGGTPWCELSGFLGRTPAALQARLARHADQDIQVSDRRRLLIWHGAISVPAGAADWPTAHLIADVSRQGDGQERIAAIRPLGSRAEEISP